MKNKKEHQQAEVLLPKGTINLPKEHELSAAHILAESFNCSVKFIPESKGYRIKTADIIMKGVEWEIKSPTGDSRKTIKRQFKRGTKQSRNIILDLRRTELTEKDVLSELNRTHSSAKSIKRIILINNDSSTQTIK